MHLYAVKLSHHKSEARASLLLSVNCVAETVVNRGDHCAADPVSQGNYCALDSIIAESARASVLMLALFT